MRQWAGHVDIVQTPQLVRELHAGWLMRKGVREKIQLVQIRYEESKHGTIMLVAQLKDGNELVFDITNIPQHPSDSRTPPTRTKNRARKDGEQRTPR